MESIAALKDTIQSMQTEHSLKLLDKDTKLNKLYKDLRETERKLLDIQSVFNTNSQKQHQRNLSPFGMGNSGE